VRRVVARQDPKQRALSRPVRPDQPDPAALRHAQRDLPEERPQAVNLRDFARGDEHGGGYAPEGELADARPRRTTPGRRYSACPSCLSPAAAGSRRMSGTLIAVGVVILLVVVLLGVLVSVYNTLVRLKNRFQNA